MLRCLIVDDEPNAVNLLELLIAEATDWEVADRCYNGLEALKSLKTNSVDFVFLDINMPQLNGMELAALLPPEIKIVFTTAYSEYAAESYLCNALDYILKPITLKRFVAAQQKIESYFGKYPGTAYQGLKAEADAEDAAILSAGDQAGPEGMPARNKRQQEYIYVKVGRGHQKVLLHDLLYVEGDREYVKLVTASNTFLVYRRLKSVEEQLQSPFIRVHNSYIVNMDHMDKYLDNHVVIGDRKIPVSDKYRQQFLAEMNHKLF
jgi:two-component system LytT family response regulator